MRRQQSMAAEIRRTGLFDENYYLATYPDVAAGGMDPAIHYIIHGWQEGRRPGPGFDPAFYLTEYPDVAAAGINPLLHYAQLGRLEGRRPLFESVVTREDMPRQVARVVTDTRSLVQAHGAVWAPLAVFPDHRTPPTLTILTDSVSSRWLFGGVGTAMVVGALAARHMGARLRLATREEAPDPAALGQVLKANQINWEGATDFAHIPHGNDRPLALGDGDIVLTTSWWTTRAALGSIDASRILYLLQEDERLFYPFGDEHLRCAETLAEPSVRMLLNTKMLFDHLANGPDPLPQLRDRSDWFEPAFPAFPRPVKGVPARSGKGNFFFYARPNSHRNLFWRGLEAIDSAMRKGILAPEEWNMYFVGRELPDMMLPGGVRPITVGGLPWSDYAKLISTMDLGLCLQYTPHPSYPPLDLAAAGAVVVTNSHGAKVSLENRSRNIIVAPPSVEGLVEGLRQGVLLTRDSERRFANCVEDRIPRDWEGELLPVLERILPRRIR
jgi:hypothetical protein